MIPQEPNFETVNIETIDLLGKGLEVPTASYSDEMLKGYQATLIEDSTYEDSRLLTFIAKFPRSILSQINTHRVFSRNSASSRARSIKSTISEVMESPYIPLFTSNQKGMSGKFLTENKRKDAIEIWMEERDHAVRAELRLLLGEFYNQSESIECLVDKYQILYLNEDPRILNVHKQNSNRVIEPYTWHEALISATEWDNFFDLRIDLDGAEPEIYAIAKLMKTLKSTNTPIERKVHQPFAGEKERLTGTESFSEAREQLMVSATEAAQISYKNKATNNKSTAKSALGERLLSSKHMSPFEHIAFTKDSVENLRIQLNPEAYHSNYNSKWVQLRRILEETAIPENKTP